MLGERGEAISDILKVAEDVTKKSSAFYDQSVLIRKQFENKKF